MRGEALEDHRRGVFEPDAVGQWHDAPGGRERVRGVGAGGEDEGDAVANGDVGDFGANGRDNAGALEPERQRQIALIEAAAQLRVEQIDARGLDLDHNLARPGRRQRHVLEHHRFRTAASVHADRFHGRDSGSLNATGCTM